MADETLYLTHEEIQDIRAKADHRDQPGARYRGQRILGYRTSGWKATCTAALSGVACWCWRMAPG